jgi:hypothetical protein
MTILSRSMKQLGVPLYFTTDLDDILFSPGKLGHGKAALCTADLHRSPFERQMIDKVADDFLINLKKGVKTVAWFGTYWQIALQNDIDTRSLRCKFFPAIAQYVFL